MPTRMRSRWSAPIPGRAPEGKNTNASHTTKTGLQKKKKAGSRSPPSKSSTHTPKDLPTRRLDLQALGSLPQTWCSSQRQALGEPLSSEPLPMLFLQPGMPHDPQLSSPCACLRPPSLGAVLPSAIGLYACWVVVPWQHGLCSLELGAVPRTEQALRVCA